MSILTPGLQIVCCSFEYLPWDHGKGVTTKTLSHLCLVVRIIHFWSKKLQTLNRVWNASSLLTDSIKTPELNTSFDEPDVITSSVSSEFLHSVLFLILLNHSLFLASDLINYGVLLRVPLSPVSLVTKKSISRLIQYISSHPAAFGFWSSIPPHNITLNPVNRKTDHSLSLF